MNNYIKVLKVWRLNAFYKHATISSSSSMESRGSGHKATITSSMRTESKVSSKQATIWCSKSSEGKGSSKDGTISSSRSTESSGSCKQATVSRERNYDHIYHRIFPFRISGEYNRSTLASLLPIFGAFLLPFKTFQIFD